MDNKKGPLVILLFLGIIIVVVVIVFFATKLFGNKGGTTTGNADITYLGLWDEAEIYEPLIQEYQQSHPTVKVTYTKANFVNQNNMTYKGVYQTNAEERIANGSADIIRVHQTWIAKLLPQLYAAPSDVLTAAQVKELYYPPIVQAITTSTGSVYGAPQIIDGLVLMYNVDAFSKAGIADPRAATKDWDVTLATAKKLTKKNLSGTLSMGGINLGSVANVRSSPEILITMLTQAAIPVVTINSTTGKASATFATNEGAAAINRYYEFAKVGAWSSRMDDDLQAFATGRLAMLIAPSWRAINIKDMNPSLKFDTAPLPVLPGANPEVPQYLASFWIDVVPKKSKYPKEAWAFIKWLSEPEQLRKIYSAQKAKRGMGNPYPIISMATEQASEPYIYPVLEMAPKMRSWPLYDYGIWEETIRKGLLEFEDRGGISTSSLQQIQSEINNLTLKR